MTKDKDYYKILGVERDASKEDIKKAYKRLAKQHHPDLNKEDPNAAEKFKEVNEAASVLGDDQKRQQYDQFGNAAFQQGNGFGGFDFSGFDMGNVDFGDIFDTFFGGGAFGRRRRSTAQRGSDLRYDLTLTLEEAAAGLEKEVRVRRRMSCEACGGAGGKGVKTCTTCHGQGMVREARRTPFGVFATTTNCPRCGGSGQTFEEVCSSCDGTGVQTGSTTIKVSVPAGVEDGMRLRVSGEGDAGVRGGPGGDLYVFISVEEHEFFERDGEDLRLSVPVSFVQAALGDEIEVPTLSGKATVKVPVGTQSGTTFRLRGKGVPVVHSSRVGDELVTVTVEVPEKLSGRQRRALEAFAETLGDKVKPQKGLFKKLFR